jgi:aspartyl-tRNA(Asn)/glutamyl-tRNA(Gln) amidotransferase subunit B
MRSAEEAGAYLKKMRSILRYLGTCDGNMEEGSMRADVNVSVRKPGDKFGTRCEIKNVNSIRFVQQAVEYEARRQVDLIEDGGVVKQQTRLFDANRGETRPMRSKEEAHDYRYFPDPDLLPLELDAAWVETIKATLPELPDPKKARFIKDYGLSAYDAGVLAAEMAPAAFYETVAKGRDSKIAANWTMGELFAVLNKQNLTIEQSPVSADALGGLLDLMADNTISGRIAKDVFAEMVETGKAAKDIVEAKGLKQITDTGPIEAAADTVIAGNPDQVAKFKGGNDKLIGWFVGQVMKATGGKANPGVVNEILRKKLAG